MRIVGSDNCNGILAVEIPPELSPDEGDHRVFTYLRTHKAAT